MEEFMAHPNEELVRSAFEAFARATSTPSGS
jgi:hypothetical protein